jgi:predicted nicotinamide N-methyase
MLSYATAHHEVSVRGVADLHMRTLLDRQQHADPQGLAEAAGISSAQWPLFGLLWPAGRQLADVMAVRPLVLNENILEIGCGLALASLVSHRRGALVTASDVHPLAGDFLLENLRLNALAPMRYCHGDWGDGVGERQAPRVAGRFELIMGSDVLYERDDGGTLPRFIQRHAAAVGEVLIVDPNRGQRSAFTRRMGLMGYELEEVRLPALSESVGPVRLLRYLRG